MPTPSGPGLQLRRMFALQAAGTTHRNLLFHVRSEAQTLYNQGADLQGGASVSVCISLCHVQGFAVQGTACPHPICPRILPGQAFSPIHPTPRAVLLTSSLVLPSCSPVTPNSIAFSKSATQRIAFTKVLQHAPPPPFLCTILYTWADVALKVVQHCSPWICIVTRCSPTPGPRPPRGSLWSAKNYSFSDSS